ncbi:hypothetical protein L873DRAFT_1848735 [Choiromyces venosus 120613-1]|uniref:Uncharacterized protein n=1 Tax=Choiromyces venosus 120613-1 TaxID=1336337 RepID=A0A3N4IWN6_9PEZI|nr:hypothetical protein L873DRAFT_1848735 [Choiromyces venosus 120613-1]
MKPILCSHPYKLIPSKHLSEWTRGRVCGLYERVRSLREISNYLNIPPITVYKIVASEEKEKEREGRGGYPKTFKAQNDAMVEKAFKKYNTTYKELKTSSRKLYQEFLREL